MKRFLWALLSLSLWATFPSLYTIQQVPTSSAQQGITGQRDGSAAMVLASQGEGVVNVRDYGATGDGRTDDTAAMQAAFAAGAGKRIYVPPGIYKVTRTLVLPSYTMLEGAGRFTAVSGVSRIWGVHREPAVLSLKGAHCCTVQNIDLYGDMNTMPDTVLLLGRDSSASAGVHHFNNVWANGYANIALVYSIASELNVWDGCGFCLHGGAALYCFYTNQADALGVDSLTPSSNFSNVFYGCQFYNPNRTQAGDCTIYLEVGHSTGHWSFADCYFVGYNDSWVRISNAVVDGGSAQGPIVFERCYGEPQSGGPNSGIHISTSGTQYVYGISVRDCRFNGATKAVYAADGVLLHGLDYSDDQETNLDLYGVYHSRIHHARGGLTIRFDCVGNDVFCDPGSYAVLFGGTKTGSRIWTPSSAALGGPLDIYTGNDSIVGPIGKASDLGTARLAVIGGSAPNGKVGLVLAHGSNDTTSIPAAVISGRDASTWATDLGLYTHPADTLDLSQMKLRVYIAPSGLLTAKCGLVVENNSVNHDYQGSTAAWMMTESEAAASLFTVTNAGGAAEAVFPAAVPGKQFTVYNNSDVAVTFEVNGGVGAVSLKGKYSIWVMNATDCVKVFEQP